MTVLWRRHALDNLAFAALATKPSDKAYGCVANEKYLMNVRVHGALGATFRVVACFSMFAVRLVCALHRHEACQGIAHEACQGIARALAIT